MFEYSFLRQKYSAHQQTDRFILLSKHDLSLIGATRFLSLKIKSESLSINNMSLTYKHLKY